MQGSSYVSQQVFDYLENDNTVFEQDPLKKISQEEKVYTYKHEGVWKPMDTLKDKVDLNNLWEKNKAP